MTLDLPSVSARLAAQGIDHDLDPGQQVIASAWRFAGGGAHVLVYTDRLPPGVVLRFHALAAEPFALPARKLATAALAARADESYGTGVLSLSRAMDADGTPTWEWAAPYPRDLALDDAFFDQVFHAFVDLVRDDVNALRFVVDGGWELMDRVREADAVTVTYVHDRTGAVLELRVPAELLEQLPPRVVTREQVTSRPGVEVLRDTTI